MPATCTLSSVADSINLKMFGFVYSYELNPPVEKHCHSKYLLVKIESDFCFQKSCKIKQS